MAFWGKHSSIKYSIDSCLEFHTDYLWLRPVHSASFQRISSRKISFCDVKNIQREDKNYGPVKYIS